MTSSSKVPAGPGSGPAHVPRLATVPGPGLPHVMSCTGSLGVLKTKIMRIIFFANQSVLSTRK